MKKPQPAPRTLFSAPDQWLARHPLTGRILLALVLGAYLVLIGWSALHPEQSDFTKFYGAGAAILEGRSPYAQIKATSVGLDPESDIGRVVEASHPNLNTPAATLPFALLALFPFPVAFWLWSLAGLGLGLWATCLLSSALRVQRLGPVLALLCFFPTWINVLYGQVTLYLVALLVLAWSWDRRGRCWGSGIALGLFTALKIFGGLFVIPLLLRRRWDALAGFTLGFLALSLLPAAWLGWQSYFEYPEVLSRVTWHAANWNASLAGFAARFLGGSENAPLFQAPQAARILSALMTLLGSLLLVFSFRRRFTSSEQAADCMLALTVPLALLISPLGWIYYFPLVIVSVFPLIALAPAGRSPGKRLVVLGWILATIPSHFWRSAIIEPGNPGFWTGLIYSLSLTLLFCGALALANSVRNQST